MLWSHKGRTIFYIGKIKCGVKLQSVMKLISARNCTATNITLIRFTDWPRIIGFLSGNAIADIS